MTINNRQLGFEILENKNVKCFGGAYLGKSHPNIKRPITTNRTMHVVLRSSRSRGRQSLLGRAKQIYDVIEFQGKQHGVKVYRQANGGNHLHLIVLPRSRPAFNGFIRSIAGIIARLMLGAQRGAAQNIQFWDQRPFSRIVEWGRDYKGACRYLLQNTLEAIGFIAYTPRRTSSPLRSSA